MTRRTRIVVALLALLALLPFASAWDEHHKPTDWAQRRKDEEARLVTLWRQDRTALMQRVSRCEQPISEDDRFELHCDLANGELMRIFLLKGH